MNSEWYQELTRLGINGGISDQAILRTLLECDEVELLPLLAAAFAVRKYFHGLEVAIHILNNVKNGLCSEDCSYCAQSRDSRAEIVTYPAKSDGEIIAEAERAYKAGAHRYCMVYAGRGPSQQRVAHIGELIREIKKRFPLEVCVSAGLIDEAAAIALKQAGLDRLNHNLNTSANRYSAICSTHTYEDRLHTLRVARQAGLEVCSGIIAGMGETAEELVELACRLREVEARSIPVNFLLPIAGNVLSVPQNLTPDYCLRILCMFRFANPDAEIRVAAGREAHLRSLEVMSLYPANSLFMDGYLNTRGNSRERTLQMIRDAGFVIRSDKTLEELLAAERQQATSDDRAGQGVLLKVAQELRPTAQG
ncbi:MAG: biotin synthase BioB [Deltaproteobacteria bacterium RIFOXYD12_FULL_57_12]|nr:MAG: biotin synthase BioB [Deltaproteobacteria bacterium RIFOXYD12_FULL_57_12]